MKKSTIWFLTIIMALTFIGLLYVQIMYMRNMVRMRDDQFVEGVKRSLYAVTTALEQDETKFYLEQDAATLETTYLPRYDTEPSTSTIDPSAGYPMPGTSDGTGPSLKTTGGSISSRMHSIQETLRGQYLYQKGLLNEVILTIISQSSNRPISERADSTVVSHYLKSELENNGLALPFDFAVVNRLGRIIYGTTGFNPSDYKDGKVFTQALFPNDPSTKINYIKVYFPTRSDYIFSSVKFMIPSFVFTLILLIIFIYTIIIAFRQKKLTEMKNDFINNMTHEFKTPISTISLAAQMLNDSAVRKSPTMLQHISGVINDETKRLRFQVEKVLQMSMFDRQKATLRLQDVDANEVITSIVNTFKLKVEKYGGRIDTDLSADDSTINVDEMHFTNVIFNLLDNAVKYRSEDRPLSLNVSTRNIQGHRIEITVADNGIGMKKEDLKRVFEKFYRVSTGNRHDVKGFGLGLAYVDKMVTEFGGEISADGELNKGTKFIIILPLTKI